MFKNLNVIPAIAFQLKLVVNLFLDKQISFIEKLVPGLIISLGILYFISPIDLIIDFLPLLGIADDFGVFIALLNLIPKLFKPEHTNRLKQQMLRK